MNQNDDRLKEGWIEKRQSGKKKCTQCDRPAVKGLVRHQLCQYHYNVMVWGVERADQLEQQQKKSKGS